MGKSVRFPCPDGSEAEGYLAEAPGARAGVVLLQEWWGLNDNIQGIADRLAAAGFTTLAPDLYHGRVTTVADEANHMMDGLDWVGATAVEVQGGLSHLKKSVSKAGVMGFCMGGALTIIACAKLKECDAGVCYYGIPPEDQARPAQIRVPFQGHFADLDDWCTPTLVRKFEAGLKGLHIPHEIHRYPVDHAFFNETLVEYDAEAAKLSWERSLAFLRMHL